MQKSASAGAISKNWGAVRKCVRNNYQSAGVRAPHSKIYRNPTSDEEEAIILERDNKIWIIDIPDEEFHNDEIWNYDFANGNLQK